MKDITKEKETVMKVCVVQPAYSTDYAQSDRYFEDQLRLLAQCDESMDLIVMPESCDVPCLAKTKEQSEASSQKYFPKLLEAATETAKRCRAMLFFNARSKTEKGLRNTTFAINSKGEIVGKYFKAHPAPS